MAGHACFSRWNPGKRRFLHGRVAVTAIDPVVGNMMLVTKWNWLLQRDIDFRRVRRPVNDRGRPTGAAYQDDSADNDDSSMNVRAFRKKLGHRNMRSFLAKESQMQAI